MCPPVRAHTQVRPYVLTANCYPLLPDGPRSPGFSGIRSRGPAAMVRPWSSTVRCWQSPMTRTQVVLNNKIVKL